MLQTLNPYPSTAKTAEIMARYRPIAPRPHTSLNNGGGSGGGSGGEGDHGSAIISQSPYLRNVWPHLQSRPTRTRKRGRTSLGPIPTTSNTKRPRTLLQGLRTTTTTPTTTLVTLPLLPMFSPPHDDVYMQPKTDHHVIDLNKVQQAEEKDFLGLLTKQQPTSNVVISPRPMRLVSSYVAIRTVKDNDLVHVTKNKGEEEVEKELEAQALPAFVSDSKNNVRLVNSAYKQMVGQPECAWLESMGACKSICGQVVLSFSDDAAEFSSGGFSCWATIEWGGVNGNKINAFGEAMRISCESKDYKFAWCFKCVDKDSEFAKCENMLKNPTRNVSM